MTRRLDLAQAWKGNGEVIHLAAHPYQNTLCGRGGLWDDGWTIIGQGLPNEAKGCQACLKAAEEE